MQFKNICYCSDSRMKIMYICYSLNHCFMLLMVVMVVRRCKYCHGYNNEGFKDNYIHSYAIITLFSFISSYKFILIILYSLLISASTPGTPSYSLFIPHYLTTSTKCPLTLLAKFEYSHYFVEV